MGAALFTSSAVTVGFLPAALVGCVVTGIAGYPFLAMAPAAALSIVVGAVIMTVCVRLRSRLLFLRTVPTVDEIGMKARFLTGNNEVSYRGTCCVSIPALLVAAPLSHRGLVDQGVGRHVRGEHRWRQWGVGHRSERRCRRLVDHLLVALTIILQFEKVS